MHWLVTSKGTDGVRNFLKLSVKQDVGDKRPTFRTPTFVEVKIRQAKLGGSD